MVAGLVVQARRTDLQQHCGLGPLAQPGQVVGLSLDLAAVHLLVVVLGQAAVQRALGRRRHQSDRVDRQGIVRQRQRGVREALLGIQAEGFASELRQGVGNYI